MGNNSTENEKGNSGLWHTHWKALFSFPIASVGCREGDDEQAFLLWLWLGLDLWSQKWFTAISFRYLKVLRHCQVENTGAHVHIQSWSVETLDDCPSVSVQGVTQVIAFQDKMFLSGPKDVLYLQAYIHFQQGSMEPTSHPKKATAQLPSQQPSEQGSVCTAPTSFQILMSKASGHNFEASS